MCGIGQRTYVVGGHGDTPVRPDEIGKAARNLCNVVIEAFILLHEVLTHLLQTGARIKMLPLAFGFDVRSTTGTIFG